MAFPANTINGMAKIHARFYPTFDPEMLKENLCAFNFNGDESLKSLSLRTPYLLLDEPTNALDISSKQILQNMIARCVDETQTLIVSTHTVSELENLYDSIIMLSKGHMLLSMPTFDITDRLTFHTSPIPPVEYLYKEQRMGLNRYIAVKGPEEEDTGIDYTLLYDGLLSPSRDNIINHLNTKNDENGQSDNL